MKTIILGVSIIAFSTGLTHANWLNDFYDKVKTDTKEVLGKEFKTTYFRDFLEKDADARNKIGISTPLLAWRFLSAEPSFIYTPKSDHEVVEFGVSFPIRIDRLPIPKHTFAGKILEKYKKKDGVSKWLKKLYFGPYISHNVSSGRFGVGINTGIRFGKN